MSEESLLSGGEESVESEVTEAPEGQAPAPAPQNNGPAIERPEWLLDKYATEDRSVEEAMAEQAKAYNELQSKFGSFIGAPEDDYQFTLPEGVEGDVDVDLPQYQEFTAWAKENNLSQEGAQDLFNIFTSYQNDMQAQFETDFTEQRKLLGPDADQRISHVNSWLSNNLSPEDMDVIATMTYTADQIGVLEKMIGKSRNTKVPGSQSPAPAPEGYSWDDFDAAIADPRYKTDSKFRELHRKKAAGLAPKE